MNSEKDLTLDVDPFADIETIDINPAISKDDEAEIDTASVFTSFKVEDEKEFPHIKLDSRDFISAINTCGTVLEKNSVDSIYKCVMIETVGKVCYFRAISPVSQLHYHCNIINTSDDLILRDVLYISHDLLLKVCKAMGSHILIIKKDDGVYLRLVGGDLKIEVESHDSARFALPEGESHEVLSVKANKFDSMLASFEGLVNAAIKSSDKRIFLHNNAVYFNDLSTWTKAEFPNISSDLILRGVDIKVLRKLISTSESTDMVFNKINNKLNYMSVETTNSVFSFIADSNKFNIDFLDNANLEECAAAGVDVDAKALKVYSNLSTILPNASEYLNLLVVNDNLVCAIEQKSVGRSKFSLPIMSTNRSLNMKDPVRVNSRKFDALLAALNCSGSVRVFMDDTNNFVYVCKIPSDSTIKEAIYSLIMKV